MIELSIIIVSYKNLQVLKECLDSVLTFNDIGNKLEIIVVEQSPADDIYNYLIDHYPNIYIIRAENKGFGAGNNRGAEVAHGKYLLFLNPDTILIEPVAQFAINHFEHDPSLGLFGVRLLNSEKKKTVSFDCMIPFGFTAKMISSISNLFGWFWRNKMYIQGADLFIRTNLFRKIGMFDEDVFMYFEEPDLCIRILKEKYQVKFFPDKRIIHLQGACSPGTSERSCLQMLDSFQHFCKINNFSCKKYLEKELKYQRFKLFCLRSFIRNADVQIETTQGIIRALQKKLNGLQK